MTLLPVGMNNEIRGAVVKPKRQFPAQVPRFLTSPQSQIVKVGGTVTFECLVLWVNKGQTKTTWTKEGQAISNSTSGRITTFEVGEVRRLQITQVEPADRGIYALCIENSRGRVERTVSLDVIVRDKMKPICCSKVSTPVIEPIPAPRRLNNEVNPTRGQKVKLNCVGSGIMEGSCNNRVELISMDNRSLPPTFLQHLSDFKAIEGRPIELVTHIRGAEEVIWLKNETLIRNSPYFKYVSDKGRGIFKLIILDPFVQDSGLYVCQASNKFGGSISFATVTFTSTGSNVLSGNSNGPSRFSSGQTLEGQQVNGTFQSESDIKGLKTQLPSSLRMLNGKVKVRGDSLFIIPHAGAQIPTEIFISDKNGNRSKVTSLSDTQPQPQVTMNPAVTETPNYVLVGHVNENGRGACADAKIIGIAQRTVDGIIQSAERAPELALVEVHAAPFIVEYAEESEDKEDLACAGGFRYASCPSPIVENDGLDSARHDSGIIAGFDGSEKSADEDESIGTIVPSPFRSVTGFKSEFKSPPFLNSPGDEPNVGKLPVVNGPSYLIALKGEQVYIRIKYIGIPQPSVQWTKNGKECDGIIDNSELSSICISEVSYDDSGRYLARISNDHGIIQHHCFLAVEGPPLPPAVAPTAILNNTGSGTRSGTGSISISWSGSPYDGGSILKAYIVHVSVDEEEWTELAVVNYLTFTLTNPKAGGSYRFRVSCKNMYGTGPPSDPSEPLEFPNLRTLSLDETLEPGGQGHGLVPEIEQILLDRDVHIRRGTLQEFYIKGEELGKGRFGTVFNVKRKEGSEDFAGKIVRCIKVADKVKVRQEVEIMNTLRHPKLLQIVDALENDKEICIITEKINGGELFERVVAEDFTLTEFDCIEFMRQIIEGVRFMHQKNIIHLDLKPENILCLAQSTYNIKIIDFGLSQKYDSEVPLRVLFGTPEFIAPEIINYEPISPASDLWAIGVITYVLISGLSPFMGDTDSETFSNITQGIFDFDDESFDTISEDAKDFISKLLIRRQEKRLTSTECLEHKWLAYPEPKKNIVIPTDKLKRFIIRRKWQKTGNAIRALGRMTNLSRKSGSTEFSSQRSNSDSGPENKLPQSSSVEEESEDDVIGTEQRRRQHLQRQQRVDSANI